MQLQWAQGNELCSGNGEEEVTEEGGDGEERLVEKEMLEVTEKYS